MPSMFAGGPPKPDKPLPPSPPRNTALEAQAAAAGRRQGLAAAFLGGPGSGSGPSSGTASHTLTGQ